MPVSLTPPPADNEIECANCGAYIYIELTRCPKCGVNLYELEEDRYGAPARRSESGAWDRLTHSIRRMFGEPHPAEELFDGALREKALFDDLLRKTGGDRAVVERLIEFERKQKPDTPRRVCLQNAIQRWERENRK
jgi:hypothetical protein